MQNGSRGETILKLVVEVHLGRDITREVVEARQQGAGRSAGISIAKQRLESDVVVRNAGILPERKIVGQVFLELIADHGLLAPEIIHAWIAREQAGGDASERRVYRRSDIGKEALNPGIVSVGRSQYRHRRVEVRLDGQRRRKEIAVVGGEVGLGRTSLH